MFVMSFSGSFARKIKGRSSRVLIQLFVALNKSLPFMSVRNCKMFNDIHER